MTSWAPSPPIPSWHTRQWGVGSLTIAPWFLLLCNYSKGLKNTWGIWMLLWLVQIVLFGIQRKFPRFWRASKICVCYSVWNNYKIKPQTAHLTPTWHPSHLCKNNVNLSRFQVFIFPCLFPLELFYPSPPSPLSFLFYSVYAVNDLFIDPSNFLFKNIVYISPIFHINLHTIFLNV